MKNIYIILIFTLLSFVNLYSQITYKIGSDIYYPDIKIQIGSDIYYPDIKIKLIKTGTVNYVIYSEKDFVSMNDIISALLPVIHKFTDYEHESLNEMFNK